MTFNRLEYTWNALNLAAKCCNERMDITRVIASAQNINSVIVVTRKVQELFAWPRLLNVGRRTWTIDVTCYSCSHQVLIRSSKKACRFGLGSLQPCHRTGHEKWVIIVLVKRIVVIPQTVSTEIADNSPVAKLFCKVDIGKKTITQRTMKTKKLISLKNVTQIMRPLPPINCTWLTSTFKSNKLFLRIPGCFRL